VRGEVSSLKESEFVASARMVGAGEWRILRVHIVPHVAPVMLARREGETLSALLKRLDKALARFYSDNVFTDEINGP